jgi:hypothetical protein
LSKLILLSILIATFAIPIRAARDPDVVRGLRRTVSLMALWIVIYVFAIVYVLPHL